MPTKLNNIPAELRSLNQWVLWRYAERDGKMTKIPLTFTGHGASVIDPKTWCSFEQAVAVCSGYNGIGFVLHHTDPFTIIDLDNKPEHPCTPEQLERHTKIFEAFDSYTERSVSGTGVHIIVRGRIPSGVHRDNVEAYSTGRFMICTGDVIRNTPVSDHQPMLDLLYGEMKPPETTTLIDIDGILDDKEVCDMAMRAVNGDKYNSLCRGEIDEYPSQSEADFALLSIIAYYTQDNEQVRRMFRMTALGKRAKAIQDNVYLNRCLEKIRAKQPAPVDLSALVVNAQALMEKNPPPQAQETNDRQIEKRKNEKRKPSAFDTLTLPPGLIGEMAQYFYKTAIRPVPEIALAAAIALASGVCGRAYNVSGSGLNQYLILLARTGAGKEGAAMGIDKLIAAVRPQLPMVEEFIGPAAFASGQSLVKVLNNKPCFVSVLGEFGLTLQQISDGRANSAEKMLKKVLLDLYAKSGWNSVLRSSVYSDIEKNTSLVQAPNVTILGESTPETFFDGLDASHIAEGLIPRFSVIEYTGPRPPRNQNAHQAPDQSLVQKFADLCAVSITTSNNNVCIHVQFDNHSMALMDEFDRHADSIMNESKVEVEMQVWNRAHLKALKLSALLAVGVNPHQPIVTSDLAQWAISFVSSDCSLLAGRFSAGDVGNGDSKQFHDLGRIVNDYFKLSHEKQSGYGISTAMFKAKIIPYLYLSRRTVNLAAFKVDRAGATAALKRAIQGYLDSGLLVEIPRPTLDKTFAFSGAAYGIGKHWSASK